MPNSNHGSILNQQHSDHSLTVPR